jgi:DNA-binding response OmpR family regulator
VIFLSALEDALDNVKGFAAGGADYFKKPFPAGEVLARARKHVQLYRLQHGLEQLVEERTGALEAAVGASSTQRPLR